MIKKQKKRKGGTGPNGAYAKTPLDFESSISSNSALLMMDGGTGSESINLKQQQLLGALGPYNGKQMVLRQS